MAERCEELRFLLESRKPLGVVVEGFRQNLDGDVAAEDGVARAIHVAHPAGAEQSTDSIGPERAAGEHGNLVRDKAGGNRERRLVEEGIAASIFVEQ